MSAAVERLLGAILAEMKSQSVELKGLRDDLASSSRPPARLSRKDRDLLTRLLPALMVLYPNREEFTSSEVINHPSPGLRVLRAGFSTKSLGRLFVRASGVSLAGYRLEDIGSALGVHLFRVMAG